MKALIFCLSLIVTDGDTVICDGARVRLLGLDCPEMRQPGGPQAKATLERLVRDRSLAYEFFYRDPWERSVARVYAFPGPDLATHGPPQELTCALIRAGACKRYRRYDRAGLYSECER